MKPFAPIFTAIALCCAMQAQAKLLISEVLYDAPNNDSTEEFIEIFNDGCSAVSLSGYSLADNGGSFNLTGSIGAGSYFVVAKNSAALQSLTGKATNQSGLTLALGNSGDYVKLRQGTTELDSVAFENAISGWAIEAIDKSLARKNVADSNTVSDWQVSSNAGNPGTGALTASCGGGDTGGGDTGGGTGDTINLPTYYVNTSGKSGEALKTALNNVLRGHVRFSYAEVWDAISYTDEDPANTSNVILLYAGRSQAKTFRAGTSSSLDAWNREHVWAKSHGFPNESQYAHTDLHHLRPEDVSLNSTRGNKDFDNGGTAVTEAPANKTDSDSFEPRAAVKGDVARMLFYMDVRYEGADDSGTPDLEIPNVAPTGSTAPQMGKLCTLVAWHLADPVDSFEQRRNNRIYELQKNRNPFIDNPQWVKAIYGPACGL
jgi:endonuclease I